MKKIEDYLHLHLGCDVLHENENGKFILELVGIEGRLCYCKDKQNSGRWNYAANNIKPLLRPLDTMTEEQGEQLATIIYYSIYGSGSLRTYNVVHKEAGKIGFILFEETNNDRVGLTIDPDRGVEFSIDEIQMNVKQFRAVHWLLSNHFDLFNLIECNLALNSLTSNKENL